MQHEQQMCSQACRLETVVASCCSCIKQGGVLRGGWVTAAFLWHRQSVRGSCLRYACILCGKPTTCTPAVKGASTVAMIAVQLQRLCLGASLGTRPLDGLLVRLAVTDVATLHAHVTLQSSCHALHKTALQQLD